MIEEEGSAEQAGSQEYSEELEFAKQLAEQAGSIILNDFNLEVQAEWKEDNTPVTHTDKDINQLVIERIKQAYPDDGILGEEASFEPGRKRLWVVDPIDGTQAFDLGAPLATFCLALVDNGEVKTGVVYDPFSSRMYTATKDNGAFMNGEAIRVSESDSLAQQYVIVSSRMEGRATAGQVQDKVTELKGKPFCLRSIVYGYTRVATGKAVASMAGTIHPWDLAAAKVILEEAGASVTDFDGNPVNYDQVTNGVVVSNGKLHQQVLDLINR